MHLSIGLAHLSRAFSGRCWQLWAFTFSYAFWPIFELWRQNLGPCSEVFGLRSSVFCALFLCLLLPYFNFAGNLLKGLVASFSKLFSNNIVTYAEKKNPEAPVFKQWIFLGAKFFFQTPVNPLALLVELKNQQQLLKICSWSHRCCCRSNGLRCVFHASWSTPQFNKIPFV